MNPKYEYNYPPLAPQAWNVPEFHRMRDSGLFGDRLVMLIQGLLLERDHGDPSYPDPRPMLFTEQEFEQLRELGLFTGQQAFLQDGVVIVDGKET